jgi:hypothetical protein
MGGLGNQMFQYASAMRIAKATQRALFVDISYLCDRNREPNFVLRDYQLDMFGVTTPLVYFPKFSTTVISDGQFEFDSSVTISQIAVDLIIERVSSESDSVLLIGYWQSARAIGERSSVCDLFKFHPNLTDESVTLLAEIRSNDSVMVNVRRTDFVTNGINGVIGMEYYSKAINHIKYLRPTARFYIFSDDIDWCQANFPTYSVIEHIHAGEGFLSYLYLMSQCKHFVIPNSTFAWWAAYLGYTNDSVVVRPKQFMPGIGLDHNELFIGLDWTIVE